MSTTEMTIKGFAKWVQRRLDAITRDSAQRTTETARRLDIIEDLLEQAAADIVELEGEVELLREEIDASSIRRERGKVFS